MSELSELPDFEIIHWLREKADSADLFSSDELQQKLEEAVTCSLITAGPRWVLHFDDGDGVKNDFVIRRQGDSFLVLNASLSISPERLEKEGYEVTTEVMDFGEIFAPVAFSALKKKTRAEPVSG